MVLLLLLDYSVFLYAFFFCLILTIFSTDPNLCLYDNGHLLMSLCLLEKLNLNF